MKKITLFASLLALTFTTVNSQNDLQHLASYSTGIEGSAETVAYDVTNQRAFFTNSASNSFTIINMSTPAAPTLVTTVDLSSYGGGPNSIAIKGNIVAVAIEANIKQDLGKVVFFDLNGNYVNEVTVGALPDMLTFTPDGMKLLVANEGEPSDNYTNDPEGTISVIDLSGGVMAVSVTSINFNAYNSKKASLQNKGIRIFGNNGTATVSQDMEPEYITVLEDGTKAYVGCQENNALVVLNLTNNTITDILPLGYKDHSLGTPQLESYILNKLVAGWPSLGSPIYDGGQPDVKLGGFSGLFYDAAASNSTDYVFYAIPDRGPNGDAVAKATVTPIAVQDLRPYKLPDYQAVLVRFTLNKTSGSVTLNSTTPLFRQDGSTPITGKGNIPGFDEVPVTYTDASTYTNTDFVDGGSEEYHQLPYDELGGDFEGVLRDNDGNFWMCDENRPSVYKFAPSGNLIERFVPKGASMLGTNPMPAGTYGKETLPSVYNKRWSNRGFEAIAYDNVNNIVYAFIQSPLYNRGSVTKDNSDVIRILGIDANTGEPIHEYVYLLERNKNTGYSSSRVDKIGDAVYKGNGKFLVIERDSEGPTATYGKKYVFEIDINVATDILNTTIATNDGFVYAPVTYLSASAGVTDEAVAPFNLPAGFTQTKLVDRNTANLDSDFASTFGAWDMISMDPTGQYVFIPHEVGQGAGLTRYDINSGDFVVGLKGNNTNAFESNPLIWDASNDDFGGIDPALWTPHNTVITAEEWASNGRLFEWMNPLMVAGTTPDVRWRSLIPSVSHEGLKFDAKGNLYFIDENTSGSIYKFVPKVVGDLSVGQTFVLKVDAYVGNASKSWDDVSNIGTTRTGTATWIAMTDANGVKLTTANPFDFTSRGGRAAADELNATPYGRPEDLEIVGSTLYLPATSEQTVYSFKLLTDSTVMVKEYVTPATLDSTTGTAIGTGINNPDNVAVDNKGNIYVIEDNNPGDIFITFDQDNDGVAESLTRWASLGVAGSEPSGLISTNNPNEFLVCIQHPSSGNDAIWKINTNSSLIADNSVDGTPLEELTADEIVAKGIRPVHKNKVINLPSVGYASSDKAEGLAFLPNNEIAVLNDNDFGLAGAGITDDSVLGIISFANDYGFDASDKDNAINITQHPTLGMFMPDAIASYKVNGLNYIVTANEGDSRDYSGYSEEKRVKDLVLNPAYYPTATALQTDANLGRLKTTTATGDYDNDGTFEQIYSYGARSFSIFDEYGNLVFDSADQFGQKIAIEEPALFNVDETKKDERSDDKGCEPEAVAIGTIDGKTYAFIGLERQSAIFMYDITNPKDVEFITYYNGNKATGDTAPEIIKFVSAADSPNSKNLLLVGYEVSGSLEIIQIGDGALSISDVVAKNDFKIFPNPVVESDLKFNKTLSGIIYNLNGQEVKRFYNETALNVSQFSSGIYIIKTTEHGVKRFVKL